jgi:LacI family transcriptional regulator
LWTLYPVTNHHIQLFAACQTHTSVLLVFPARIKECEPMLRGIAEFRRSHGTWPMFLDDQGCASSDPSWLNLPWRGVISRQTTATLTGYCAVRGIPLVDLDDSPCFSAVPKIRPDNVAIGQVGADDFLRRGYRYFGFCSFGNEEWAQERRDGFVNTLRRDGHSCHVFEPPSPGILSPAWDVKQTQILTAWMVGVPKPIGIMACNDLLAMQVIAAAAQARLLVPEQVAVIGANNDETRCELTSPQLSSVASNAFRAGYLAAETLNRLWRGETVAPEVRLKPLGIVSRLSSSAVATDNRFVAAALRFIRENEGRTLTVDDLVQVTGASRSSLERGFRRYVGHSPQVEIRASQVAHAKRLLVDTDHAIRTVANLAGFKHHEYMSMVFKRATGDTPGQFRKKTRGNRSRHAYAASNEGMPGYSAGRMGGGFPWASPLPEKPTFAL